MNGREATLRKTVILSASLARRISRDVLRGNALSWLLNEYLVEEPGQGNLSSKHSGRSFAQKNGALDDKITTFRS